jgi:hypothetical protein
MTKADRLKTRDLEAKTDRFMTAFGYSKHDAELLAEAEWDMEQEKAKGEEK